MTDRPWHLRPVVAAAAVAVLLSACGAFSEIAFQPDATGMADCGMRPVDSGAGIRIGPSAVKASCAAQVEVDGRTYFAGVGRWLDESILELSEYGAITRSNVPVDEPIAYALAGVDPTEVLLMKGNGTDDLGPMGPYMVLWGEIVPTVPASLCAYVDPTHEQTPAECH